MGHTANNLLLAELPHRAERQDGLDVCQERQEVDEHQRQDVNFVIDTQTSGQAL